mmetsp:Transcript_53879/g.108199  ORF Transcript_53879/g.108199 Transcript_53879/m.108199 type:complete len:279 (+) Transcript_53879:97-933(+)
MFPIPTRVILSSILCLHGHGLRVGDPAAPGIPKVLYVTASYPKGSPEHQRILGKFGSERGIELQYFDDEDRRASAQLISSALEAEGIVGSAYEAYTSLRPFAYKADLWRYMILWYCGGVYVDMNIQLRDDLSSWIDFDIDELVLVSDQEPGRYWNGMMASKQRSGALAAVIRHVVRNVHDRYYGETDLDITGPRALSRALQQSSTNHHIKANYCLREEMQGACGSFPNPPCKLRVYSTDDGSVLASKARARHEDVHDHYSKLYGMHAVYCDEPGPPCK